MGIASKKKVTKKMIAGWKAAGRDYVGDMSCDKDFDPDEFCGQSEAYDMTGMEPDDLRDIAADYIYEGMLERLKIERAKRAATATAFEKASTGTVAEAILSLTEGK